MIRPVDFYSEAPPPRIMGTEKECNIQLASGIEYVHGYIDQHASEQAGYQWMGGYIDNGFRLYVDAGNHLEVATAECLGPRQAAAADAAGIIVLSNIVSASGIRHAGLHSHSGTMLHGKELSSGYHENYMIPRSLSSSTLVDTVVASHLTSRMFAGSGMVGSGFQLSQKVQGTGGPPITRQLSRRTEHGNKPMATIPSSYNDEDTVGPSEWARLEVRFADSGFSRTARFLSLASTSLVLRLVEHARLIDARKLHNASFRDHSRAIHAFNDDLSFCVVAETLNGRHMSAIDYQEALIEQCEVLDQKVQLQKDEHDAIPLWRDVHDRLRKSDMKNGDYQGLLAILEFAPRHRYLNRKHAPHEINSHNKMAVARHLAWDRLLPEGGGLVYWKDKPSPYVTDQEVEELVHTAPKTRAAKRADYIRNKDKYRLKRVNWATIVTEDGKIPMNDSYDYTAAA